MKPKDVVFVLMSGCNNIDHLSHEQKTTLLKHLKLKCASRSRELKQRAGASGQFHILTGLTGGILIPSRGLAYRW